MLTAGIHPLHYTHITTTNNSHDPAGDPLPLLHGRFGLRDGACLCVCVCMYGYVRLFGSQKKSVCVCVVLRKKQFVLHDARHRCQNKDKDQAPPPSPPHTTHIQAKYMATALGWLLLARVASVRSALAWVIV